MALKKLDRYDRVTYIFGMILGLLTSISIFAAVFALFGIWK